MSNKYSRYSSVISRHADENIDEDHWLKQFQNKLQKGGVQSKTTDSSLFDQINAIMNGKSKHTSVEAAVEDMKERSGLTAYLKTATDSNQVIDKKIDIMPIVIKKSPNIKNTIENYIKDSKGNLPVPAIIDKIRSIHQSDVSEAKDWEDDDLIKFISELNLKEKKNNPDNFQNYSNLGLRDGALDSEIDPSNTDAFHGLTPVKF